MFRTDYNNGNRVPFVHGKNASCTIIKSNLFFFFPRLSFFRSGSLFFPFFFSFFTRLISLRAGKNSEESTRKKAPFCLAHSSQTWTRARLCKAWRLKGEKLVVWAREKETERAGEAGLRRATNEKTKNIRLKKKKKESRPSLFFLVANQKIFDPSVGHVASPQTPLSGHQRRLCLARLPLRAKRRSTRRHLALLSDERKFKKLLQRASKTTSTTKREKHRSLFFVVEEEEESIRASSSLLLLPPRLFRLLRVRIRSRGS